MKKAIIILMCLVMCLSLCACKGTGKALTVNGREVDHAEYAFYLNYNRLKLFGQRDAYTNAELEEARQAAVTQIKAAETVRQRCVLFGIRLSAQQTAALAAEKAALKESLGGKKEFKAYLKASCLTERTYDKLAANELYYNLLQQYVTERDGAMFTDSYLREYYADNYAVVKYIRISLYDENGQAVTEKEAAKAAELAQTVAQKAADGEDFDVLILRYSDDTQVQGGTEGLVVSAFDAASQPYLQAAFELDEGQTSGVCAQSDGLYVVKRMAAPEEYFEPNLSYIRTDAESSHFAQVLEDWTNDAEVETHKAAAKITFSNLKKYVR